MNTSPERAPLRIDSAESYLDETMRVHHDSELFEGEVETRDAEGNVVGLITYWQGIAHGPYTTWYSNGHKREQGVCDAGRPVAVWQRWDENGDLVEHKKSGITRGL